MGVGEMELVRFGAGASALTRPSRAVRGTRGHVSLHMSKNAAMLGNMMQNGGPQLHTHA